MSLVTKYSDIISYVISLNSINFKDCKISTVQLKLYQYLDLAKKDILVDYDENNYNESLFAICAWIDETVLCSNWQDKSVWGKKMLQYSFFGTLNAGEIFFEKLEQIAPNNTALLELYLYMIKLGFRGKYYDSKDIPFINEKSKDLYNIITKKYSGEFDKPLNKCVLFPNAKINDTVTIKQSKSKKNIFIRKIGLWLMPLFPLIIISVLLNEFIKNYFSNIT